LTEFLPYGRQTIGEADIQAVAACLSEPFITQGPRVEQFEQAFAGRVQARHAVAFANGTAALHGAAAAAGLGVGDEVLTTPISFVASSNCALFVGARPRFVDIDASSGNLDCAAAAALAHEPGVKACVAVSLAGLPVDLAPLQDARREGLIVIEDGCHALGATRGGRPVGGDHQADMTVFSFHPVKAITTGEGGMVTTEDDALADALRAFRTHGIRRREHPDDVMHGGWHYDVDTLGFNYRITDFQCALGEQQLTRLDEFIEARNRIAAHYRERFAAEGRVQLPLEPPAGERHGYHLFVVRFPGGAARRRAVYDHLRQAGIGTQLHYIPIPAHALYRSMGYSMDALPAAQAYYEQALSLPMFPAMREQDVDRVVREVRAALSS
jgi:UDP-4-amino-4,6-dideoxy-N-acetyl-beta-L-altrosamine transaminase